MLILADGVLDPRIDEHPWISDQQAQAMLTAAQADPGAEIVGFDAKLRPVIRVRFVGARTRTDYALFRGGKPTRPAEPLEEVEWE